MGTKAKSKPHPEIAHVLFIDLVGYSKLLINEQREVVDQLTRVVRKVHNSAKASTLWPVGLTRRAITLTKPSRMGIRPARMAGERLRLGSGAR